MVVASFLRPQWRHPQLVSTMNPLISCSDLSVANTLPDNVAPVFIPFRHLIPESYHQFVLL